MLIPAIAGCSTLMLQTNLGAQDWKENAIAPVANPIFFETPLIQSEIRPIFAWHRLDNAFLGTDADVRVYAVQLRYAVTEKLAFIATKDGYIEFNPKNGPAADGWADLSAGLKYALYENTEHHILVTPGFTFEFPTGNRKVFQGNGDGEANVFVSAMKGWNNFHATINIGARIPLDFDEETANVRYNGMLDYYVLQYFIPFAAINAFTTVSEGKALPFGSEGFDLINFGSSNAEGETQASWALGFRSRLHKKVDLGFAYERGFTPSNDIFDDRFTVDLAVRF